MAIKCPKCSATIDAAPDELGLVTCAQCGARLRSKQAVKVTVQGASSSSPSLPKIDPSRAAPADVDHVLARLDTPSPDETVRPGALPKQLSPAAGPQAGAVFDMLLSEIRAIKRTQDQILALLQSGPAPAAARGEAGQDDDEVPAPRATPGAERHTVLLVDDDPRTRQEAESALQSFVTVKTAPDGNSALATIAMEKPSVIVLELGISGSMPGRDLVNMIKATMEWVDIPIVIYTRLPLGEGQEARQEHGADEIVTKGQGSARALAGKVGAILKKA